LTRTIAIRRSAYPLIKRKKAMLENLFDIAGKVVLVTGGAQGLGRMIAEGFVRAGCRVSISSRHADAGSVIPVDEGMLGCQ
jgi:short-subunit dehydrogenase